MTHEERDVLRQRVDAAVRERLSAFNLAPARMCSGCHGEFFGWVLGCRTCWARHYRWHTLGRYPNGRAWYLARKIEIYEDKQMNRPRGLGTGRPHGHSHAPHPNSKRSLAVYFLPRRALAGRLDKGEM